MTGSYRSAETIHHAPPSNRCRTIAADRSAGRASPAWQSPIEIMMDMNYGQTLTALSDASRTL
jgi:hypothetical protein